MEESDALGVTVDTSEYFVDVRSGLYQKELSYDAARRRGYLPPSTSILSPGLQGTILTRTFRLVRLRHRTPSPAAALHKLTEGKVVDLIVSRNRRYFAIEIAIAMAASMPQAMACHHFVVIVEVNVRRTSSQTASAISVPRLRSG